MIKIRHANSNDLPQILPLLDQLSYPITLDAFTKRYNKFLNQDGYKVAVACIDKKIVGFIALSKSIFFVVDKTRIHIEGIVVDKNYQKMNIGKMLISYAENYAKEFSPAIIDLTSGKRRAASGTHEFYKKLGYKNEGLMEKLYFRKEI